MAEGNWEREVIEKLALAALKEQRRSRRWGIFFKLLGFAYLTLLLLIALDWRVQDGFTAGKHTALVDIVGVIDPKGDASADRVTAALQGPFRRGSFTTRSAACAAFIPMSPCTRLSKTSALRAATTSPPPPTRSTWTRRASSVRSA